MKVYIYVTKGGKTLVESNGVYLLVKKSDCGLNGKVAACFDCNEIDDLKAEYAAKPKDGHFCEVLKKSCLTARDLERYCPTGSKKGLFAWKIENLEKLVPPFCLSSFSSVDTSYRGWENEWHSGNDEIKRAPQSWMYAIVYFLDGNCDCCILMSVRPEWACKILNGEKTYEIRTTKPKEAL